MIAGDPIFGKSQRNRGSHRKGGEKPTHHDKGVKAAHVKDAEPAGIQVTRVRTALEVMSMCVSLGYNCALFIDLVTCPFCRKFTAAWNKACATESPVLWLCCRIKSGSELQGLLPGVTFPCLAANGNVHASDDSAPTSTMSASEIVSFAQRDPPDGTEQVEFIDDDVVDDAETGESNESGAASDSSDSELGDNDIELLTDHSDEESEVSSGSLGDTDLVGFSDDGGGDEVVVAETPGMRTEPGGFKVTEGPLDSKLRGRTVVCYYMNGCGGCQVFKPEWNAAVSRAPGVVWAAVDVDKEPEVFEATQSNTVPHLQLFVDGTKVRSGGPMDSAALVEWIRS